VDVWAKSVLTAFAACVTGGLAVGAIHANGCEPFVVRVNLQVNHSIRSRVITADLKDEAAALWKPYGVHLEWADPGAPAVAPHGFSVDAVLDRRIDEPDLPKWAAVLGRASLNLQAPSVRPIRVSLDATEQVLMLRTSHRASIARLVNDRELGRALGRVLAHELGHLLLGAPYHDEVGLMRAVYRPDELGEPDRAPFRLTCIGVGRLRGRIGAITGTEPEPIDPEPCLPGRAVR
jgi:hypothetical protein